MPVLWNGCWVTLAPQGTLVFVCRKLARHTVHLTNLSWTTLFTEDALLFSAPIFNSKPMALSAASISMSRGVVLVLQPRMVASQMPVLFDSSLSVVPVASICANRNFRNGLEFVTNRFECISALPYERPHSLAFLNGHSPIIPNADVESVNQIFVHLYPTLDLDHRPATRPLLLVA